VENLGTVGIKFSYGNMGCFGSFCIGLGFGVLHLRVWKREFGIGD